jgi:hypothetical protein
MARNVHIEEMVLRVPGLTRAQAESVARQVTQRIAAGLPSGGRVESLAAIARRVNVPAGTPFSELPARIAAAVLEALK